MIPYAMRLYKAVRQVGESPGEHWKLCDEFRSTFARPVPGSGSDDRRFPVHFLGVWDTVSSVGWIWDPVTFPFTARNPSIQIVRHAVSIDERRAFFRQNLMKEAEQQDFRELWFPGVLCDVGGGYPDNQGELWLSPYLWILDEAIGAGMMVDTERRREFIAGSHPQPWNDRLHKSLRSLWWIAEFLPKMSGRPASPRRSPRLGLGRRRVIKEGAIMHASTLLRIREADYEPPNLSNDFVARVRRLSEVPDALPFSH